MFRSPARSLTGAKAPDARARRLSSAVDLNGEVCRGQPSMEPHRGAHPSRCPPRRAPQDDIPVSMVTRDTHRKRTVFLRSGRKTASRRIGDFPRSRGRAPESVAVRMKKGAPHTAGRPFSFQLHFQLQLQLQLQLQRRISGCSAKRGSGQWPEGIARYRQFSGTVSFSSPVMAL